MIMKFQELQIILFTYRLSFPFKSKISSSLISPKYIPSVNLKKVRFANSRQFKTIKLSQLTGMTQRVVYQRGIKYWSRVIKHYLQIISFSKSGTTQS